MRHARQRTPRRGPRGVAWARYARCRRGKERTPDRVPREEEEERV